MTDTYRTIGGPSTGEFRERGSRFLAYAFPVQQEKDCHHALDALRKQHPKARHFCFAWRLGLDKNLYRSNDDGEPSGTAGKPILGQIDSFSLTYIFIVVVRYFGGTLLGTSGLIQAYRTSARAALQAATIFDKTVENLYTLTLEYALLPDVMQVLKKLGIEIVSQHFKEVAVLEIAVRQSLADEVWLRLKAFTAKVSLEEARLLEAVSGLQMALNGVR